MIDNDNDFVQICFIYFNVTWLISLWICCRLSDVSSNDCYKWRVFTLKLAAMTNKLVTASFQECDAHMQYLYVQYSLL